MNKYPRYFVMIEPNCKTWMSYAYIEDPGGITHYVPCNKRIYHKVANLGLSDESLAERYVKDKMWREITTIEELVLLVS